METHREYIFLSAAVVPWNLHYHGVHPGICFEHGYLLCRGRFTLLPISQRACASSLYSMSGAVDGTARVFVTSQTSICCVPGGFQGPCCQFLIPTSLRIESLHTSQNPVSLCPPITAFLRRSSVHLSQTPSTLTPALPTLPTTSLPPSSSSSSLSINVWVCRPHVTSPSFPWVQVQEKTPLDLLSSSRTSLV